MIGILDKKIAKNAQLSYNNKQASAVYYSNGDGNTLGIRDKELVSWQVTRYKQS